jgi:hypothetical protein
MDAAPSNSTAPQIPLANLVAAMSDITRWRILGELIKGDPLPVHELARRTTGKRDSVAKHCRILLEFGIVRHEFNLYKINPALLVPGQAAIDLGAAVLRLDRLG